MEGFYGDSAVTVAVGKVSPRIAELLKVTEASLFAGIAQAVVGNRLSDISHAVQQHAEAAGFSVVTDFVGHVRELGANCTRNRKCLTMESQDKALTCRRGWYWPLSQ